jgi:hypothetical protein
MPALRFRISFAFPLLFGGFLALPAVRGVLGKTSAEPPALPELGGADRGELPAAGPEAPPEEQPREPQAELALPPAVLLKEAPPHPARAHPAAAGAVAPLERPVPAVALGPSAGDPTLHSAGRRLLATHAAPRAPPLP